MITTAIFDMDGLLTESESRWRIAEREAVARLGLPLTDADFDSTMGVRMAEITEMWFAQHPWEGPSPAEVCDQVVGRVIELGSEAVALPGVYSTIEWLRGNGVRLALCSSSPTPLVEVTLEALSLTDAFEVVHSAEDDAQGKPHPLPYLVTAELMGADPAECLVFEDSLSGCVSAKAAGMKVVAVPDPVERGSGRFGLADLVVDSLEHCSDALWSALEAGTPVPGVSRPRFHLAFGVDDLDQARVFYAGTLGCREGRSADTWIDFDLWGHQVVAHLDPNHDSEVTTNAVDGKQVPAHHFGVVLYPEAWRELVARLEAAGAPFILEPQTRFAGLAGEQHTCFVTDPAGNALEFKAFARDRDVFAVD